MISSASSTIDRVNLTLSPVKFEWNQTEYENETNFYIEDTYNLEASSLTLSGFSAGASQAANMMAFYNDNIDGLALLSGRGPCATFGVWDSNTNTRNDQCWEPTSIKVGH